MPLDVVAVVALALFFALNIGMSGVAASMAQAYGAGALPRRVALGLAAVFVILGGILQGRPVIETIGRGIVPPDVWSLPLVAVALGAAALSLFSANLMRVPLSTSQVTVGALVGVALAMGVLQVHLLQRILLAWLLLPSLALAGSFTFGRWVYPVLSRALDRLPARHACRRAMWLLLVLTGCYEAYAAGTNNLANAVGPLLGAGIVDATTGMWLGALFFGAGALLGGGVLETNAKRITSLCPIQGSFNCLWTGTLVVVASTLGLPVPLTQVSTCCIIGMGWGKPGRDTLQVATVKRVARVWVLSPVVSVLVALLLITALELNAGLAGAAPPPAGPPASP